MQLFTEMQQGKDIPETKWNYKSKQEDFVSKLTVVIKTSGINTENTANE